MTVCDPWTTELELTACACPSELLDGDHVADVIAAASDWLHRMSGERFGVCTYTERPCRTCLCDAIPGSCLCGAGGTVIELNHGPIVGTPTVTIDGAAFSSFYVLPPNRLIRTDNQAWPSCQSLESGKGMTVTYDAGAAVPELGRLAASDLTIELLKSCHGQTCALPAGTTQVNRRGVTISLERDKAGASLPRVAMFLGAYPRASAGLTRVDRPRSLTTAGPT